MNSPKTCDPTPTDDSVLVDAICDVHGAFVQRVLTVMDGLPPVRSRCPQCEAERDAATEDGRKRREAAVRLLRVEQLTGDSGVPLRFRDRSFANFKPENSQAKGARDVCQRFAKDFAGQRERGRSIVLTGGPGTGKTHLACAIANHVIEHHLATVKFVTVSDMLRRVKETYRKDATATESDVIRAFAECDLLIVDEIGVQVGSDHEKLLVFEILNGRYQNLAPTILISNLAAEELETFLGHRVMDRFRECGVVLAFEWDSYRGRKA